MRARWTLRAPGAARIAAGALAAVCVGLAPIALGTGTAHAQNGDPPAARVNTRFAISYGTREAQTGHVLTVTGRLRPATAGETVSLMLHEHGRWITVGHAHTARSGRFVASELVRDPGAYMARVAFAGSGFAQPSSTKVGLTVGMLPEVASWYDDGGNTACGFHATYGVASRTLPCGAHVRLEYDGRALTAIVDDRGPYVAGRTFDLDQTTAGALGMDGVATVLAS